MATELYVTIHDEALIEQCEAAGQFDLFPNRTYLFVGRRPITASTSSRYKVVVCQDFMPNYERYPQFYDFTGWWVLADHHLISADRIVCLQYDMTIIDPDLPAKVDAALINQPGMIAFNAGYMGPNWMLQLPTFEETYRAGLATVGVNPDDFHGFNEWPCTQGTAWTTKTFVDYMRWFTPMFEAFHDHIFAGHLAERTVKAYLAANGIPDQYMLGSIAHTAADCHGTGALMAGNREIYEARNAEFMG